MHVAFVKNSQDHVHDENGGDQKQWQRLKKLPKHKRLALKSCLNARILSMYLRKRVFDKFRGITNRNVREQIKINRDAGELIEVIHRLRTNDLARRCYSAQRNEIGARSGCGGNAIARRAALANRAAAIAPDI